MSSPLEIPVVDGRRARRERGRTAVVDAMVDLVQEGHHPPTVEAIAARAGVSVASVFRYFERLDDLQSETAARFLERHAPLFEIDRLGVGPRDARTARYVAARTTLYPTIAPMARFVRSRALEQPRVAATLGQMRRRLADQADRHFAPELDALTPARRTDVVGSIATLTSFESWDALRHDLGTPDAALKRAWTSALRALLPPSPG